MRKIKITIIGCGRRVRQDVIASALAAGISDRQIQLLASQSRKILIRGKLFKVFKISKNLIKGDIVYFAVPPTDVKKLYLKYRAKLKGKIIIIDTPIIYKNLGNIKNDTIIVAEDIYPLLEKFVKPNLNFNNINFLYFKNSFFFYHGICFVQTMLGKIRFMINLPFFKIFVASKGIALAIGNKNYEFGDIIFNFKTLHFPKLNSENFNLIGGKTDYDTFSYRFLDLKRLGLKEIFKNINRFIINKSLSYSNGNYQYNLSKRFFYLKLN